MDMPSQAAAPRDSRPLAGLANAVAGRVLDPMLMRTVRRLAVKHRSIFDRLGPHVSSVYIIDPVEFPFALILRPDPAAPSFRTVSRDALPAHDALIRGRFRTLFDLVDAGADGDASFFSRDLEILGNTDAVVTLRNALDDVDGSIAADTADLFGPPGRMALTFLRRGNGAAAPGRVA
ncbi:SCP2 domain-containing protein [Zhengella sp. ZM62]|uniref:SCP2 domain-containing protein n=1 Tax=Zhengella sedimenti TaxID=3390035 RepID=UPI003975F2B3